ncbi:MAG: cytidylate kinase family protein [Candidatus Aenigmatarchaeota archaeon]
MTYLIDMTCIKRKDFLETEKGKAVNHPVIAISGLSGSGKSMYSTMLQKRLKEDYNLDMPIYESGAFFREQAKELGMTVEEFGSMLKNDMKKAEEVDVAVDKRTLEMALEKPGIYLGRLTVYIIGEHGYKIFLKANPKLVAKRILADPNRDETKRGLSLRQITDEIVKRDRDNTERYRALYGIDYGKDVPACADIIVKNNHAPELVFKDFYEPLVEWMKEKGYVK